MLDVRKKWRPSLVTLITLVVGVLIALPLIGLMAARLSSNQFVRETESSLLSQAAIVAQFFASEYSSHLNGPLHGQIISGDLAKFHNTEIHHTPVSLTTEQSKILPERPKPAPTNHKIDPVYQKVGAAFSKLTIQAQRSSLAGYQAVDPYGNIIGGTGNLTGGFAKLPEIQAALHGKTTTLLRYKSGKNRNHPLASISRDTGFRVYVAMPVIVDDHVVGAVYLTRTPSNLRSFLYRERQTIMLVTGSVILAAFVVGLLLWRLLAGPIKDLQRQSENIEKGPSAKMKPIKHYGTKETADLGRSILSMSTKLKQRSDSLQSYTAHVTHELKSPLTSIIGAVELLAQSGDKMDAKTQKKFYRNIQSDGNRMTQLLDDLRKLAASDMAKISGKTNLANAIERCRNDFPDLQIDYVGNQDAMLPMQEQDLNVVLAQLIQNAKQHGATKITFTKSTKAITIQDNGTGISKANQDKIFDPFFTTNRNNGGSGMGLAIVHSTIRSYHGAIYAEPSSSGAKFRIEL